MNTTKNTNYHQAAMVNKQPACRARLLNAAEKRPAFKLTRKVIKHIPEDWIDVYLSRFLS